MPLTLYYFPLRARAECIKMILAYTNSEYNFQVVNFETWSEESKNIKLYPFGQVPTLKLENDEIIAESGAISRYIALVNGIFPLNPTLAAKNEMVYELSQDMNMINPLVNWFEYQSEKWTIEHQQYYDKLPRRLEALKSILGGSLFFGGEKPSHADFALYHILDLTVTLEPNSLYNAPEMLLWKNRVAEIPAVKRYLDERPSLSSGNVGRIGSFARNQKSN